MKQWKVGIFLFDEVEVLDFAGPFEVFTVTACSRGKPDEWSPFHVCTFSTSGDIVKARNRLKITPDYSLETLPECEILVFPGGPGVRRILDNDRIRTWIADRIGKVEIMTSVCTGVYLLANAGLLDGKRATTHSASIPYLRDLYPAVTAIEDVKYVDEGTVITSGGISAGIHMALHVVHRLLGAKIAWDTATYMDIWNSISTCRLLAILWAGGVNEDHNKVSICLNHSDDRSHWRHRVQPFRRSRPC